MLPSPISVSTRCVGRVLDINSLLASDTSDLVLNLLWADLWFEREAQSYICLREHS